MLVEAEKRSFKYLIVNSRDRLARVVEEHIAIDVFLKKFGIKVIYLREGEISSNSNAVNKLIDVILSSIAEFETNLLSNRVKDGNRKCLERGWWPGGRAPFGYYRIKAPDDIKEKHSVLKKSNFDSKIVEKVFSLYTNQGLGYKRIADAMQKDYGYIRWSKSKVRAIINNNSYIGSLFWDRRGSRHNPKMHSLDKIISSKKNDENEIVSNDTWNKCVAIRKKRDETKDPRLLNTPFLLKHKLICAKCGEFMKTKNPGKNKEMVYYCESEICRDQDTKHKLTISRNVIEDAFNNNMKQLFSIKNFEEFQQKYEEMYSSKKLENENNVKEITELIKKTESDIENISYKLNSNTIDNALIKQALEMRKRVLCITVGEYKRILKNLEDSIRNDKIIREKFRKICDMIPEYFFTLKFDKTDENYEQVLIQRRIFVLIAIDYVEVNYDKLDEKFDMIIKCNFLEYI